MKKSPDQGNRCSNCKHFKDQTESTDEVKWGICRRYPKQWYWDGTDAVCDWPQQDPDDCCGEWGPKQ